MNTAIIVFKAKAESVIRKRGYNTQKCYYLSEDYEYFLELKEKLDSLIEIRNLRGIFAETVQDLKAPYLELLTRLNKEHDSLEWWCGHIASRNTASTPLFLNIVYLFCVRKLLSGSNENFLFVVENRALAACISDVARSSGFYVRLHGSNLSKLVGLLFPWLVCLGRIGAYFWDCFKCKKASLEKLRPLKAEKTKGRKRVVLRSWVTKGTFDKDGKFRDRNFGSLASWLRSNHYEVWTLPTFFNLDMKLSQIYALMNNADEQFIIPDHYLKLTDYFVPLFCAWRLLRKKLSDLRILGVDVTPLFHEVNVKWGFGSCLDHKNLCYPMLKRLKEKGFEIDGFYYAFENNCPEKAFILACRRFYPCAKIVGYQHTVFLSNQLAYQLGQGEAAFHPLPDKIVCSAPIYLELHQRAGFKREMLVLGGNLRFKNVWEIPPSKKFNAVSGKTAILVPLTVVHSLALELLSKLKMSLGEDEGYSVHIRTHPILDKDRIIRFLKQINLRHFEFADNGNIQQWFSFADVVVSAGGSVTILEAVSAGVPTIRVIPDNTFFFDPLHLNGYPLDAVQSPEQIRKQLEMISGNRHKTIALFSEIGGELTKTYFPKATEEMLSSFL